MCLSAILSKPARQGHDIQTASERKEGTESIELNTAEVNNDAVIMQLENRLLTGAEYFTRYKNVDTAYVSG